MSIKSILCVYGGALFEQNALCTALSLADHFKAEARFLHISIPPDVYPELYGMTLYGQAVTGDAGGLESIAEANEEQRNIAQTRVIAAAKAGNIAFSREDCLDGATGAAIAVFCPVTARTRHCLPPVGRLADLIVIGRETSRFAGDLETVMCGLFDTGRPVLVIPHADDHPTPLCLTRKVAVAWDGSLPAARALYHALPLLRQADQVQIICVRPTNAGTEFEPEGGLAHWLDLHELTAHIHRVERYERTSGEAILSDATAFGADWLVMGAYGHNHIGEMILGGATNHILKHSDMPVFLAH
ncbi:universal stress protein [Asticcacaulis sp.]|uniref:universal stress protein n=1 Tax=Asticcacaulis sp. TaxID=1872648 RepID=UPI002C51B890|nr:universal stress protein [Asticcacaulis sp.]HTM82840.1 universal stress protein [Asticcacaulis sp.]